MPGYCIPVVFHDVRGEINGHPVKVNRRLAALPQGSAVEMLFAIPDTVKHYSVPRVGTLRFVGSAQHVHVWLLQVDRQALAAPYPQTEACQP